MRVTLEDMERLERVALDLDGRIKTLEAELTEARAALVYKRQVADEAIRQLHNMKAERDLERKRKEHERREAVTARAERDAALKLVDDTLEAVGHQHDLGLTVCSCGKLMPPRTPDAMDAAADELDPGFRMFGRHG